mgnify:CR=1 FL=1
MSEDLAQKLKKKEATLILTEHLLTSSDNELKRETLHREHLEREVSTLREQVRTLQQLIELKQTMLEMIATQEIMQDKVLYEVRMLAEEIRDLPISKHRKLWNK